MSSRRRARDLSRVVASILTTAGLSCAAISANELVIAPVVAAAVVRNVARVDGGADCAGAGIVEPATMRPTRKDTVATRQMVTSRNRRGIATIIGLCDQESGIRTRYEGQQISFAEQRHSERLGFVRLAARLVACKDGGRFLADRAGNLCAEPFKCSCSLLAGHR